MNTFSITDKKIGIIGFGKFGEIVNKYIFPKNSVIVFSPHIDNIQLPSNCVSVQTITDVIAQSDIIVPAVPIRKFEEVIKEIAPILQPNQLIMEICSVKEYPIKIMKKYLSKNIRFIATHPMFGPISIKMNQNKLKNLRLVLCKISSNGVEYNIWKNYFLGLGLEVLEMLPEEHDAIAARSHFFSKIIKYMSDNLMLQKTPLDTPTAGKIFDALQYTADDRIILLDMLRYNKYCQILLGKILISLTDLEEQKENNL